MAVKHLLHAKSNVVTEGQPKLPEAARIEYGEIAVNYAAGHETLSLKNSENAIVTFSSDNQKIINVTYSQLVTLKTNSKLIPGVFYRITDYVTTTAQTGTQSAGHAFDIIVLATENNVLSENAWAALHSGDTYFANCNLDAWELKYRLENDTANFAWADSTNGKGVIFYMKDEWDNECPYDFKNIQFARYWITADTSKASASLKNTWLGCYELNGTTKVPSTATFDSTPKYMYTFTKLDAMSTSATVSDYSVVLGSDSKSYCYDNKMGLCPYGISANKKFYLNNIVFFATSTTSDMCGNTFGNYCQNNSFGNSCYSNTFGNNCHRNSFGNSCYHNSFGSNCYGNSFGNECYKNTFGDSCYSNIFGNNCYRNTFGNSCYSNSFGNYCQNNSFGISCYSNSFGNACSSNSFGISCYFNTFGNNCTNNSFGNYCYYNSFGIYCCLNSFGSGCQHINFSKDYMYFNIVENGNQYITVTSTKTTSSSNILRNFTISQGVNNTTTTKTISHDTVKDTYQTIYGMNTKGELVSWCPADHVIPTATAS